MRLRHLYLLMTVCTALLLTACANPGSGPDGGPYDETPPRIVSLSPAQGGLSNSNRKVTLTFDELIKIENAQEKIIVSPPQIEQPEIKTSGRRISVQLLDSLKPNTTYTIDFSDAIVDANEGNPLGNFTYFFSTGTQVDTMEVGGHVLTAEDLEPVKGILVGLHADKADSAFTRKPFDRVARTDGNGRFSIKGVAPGSYRIYALKDMDGDFRYARGEMLAFNHDTIVPGSYPDVRHDTLWADTVHIDTIKTVPFTHFTPDNVVLLAFNETNTTRALLKTQREPAYFRTFFTAPSRHVPEVRGLNFDASHGRILEERSAGNDTITYWLADTALVNQDTLRLAYTYEATDDSTGINGLRTDTLELIPRFSYERRQRLKAQEMAKWEKQLERRHKRGDYSQETPPATPLDVRWNVSAQLAPDRNLHFSLPEPAERLDTAAFHLYLKIDSAHYEPQPFRLTRDTLSLLNYTLRGAWRPGQAYVLNVDSAAVSGLSGLVSRSFDRKFSIATEEDYGSLFLLLPDADSTALVQLLSASGKVSRQVAAPRGRADFFYLQPGDYYVRLIADRNGNGRWDTGEYASGREPEAVYYFPQKFTVRANWDIEQTWRIHELPLDHQKPRELIKQREDAKQQTPHSRNAERERQKRGG